MKVILKLASMASFWVASLLCFVIAYDGAIYTATALNKSPSLMEIIEALIYFNLGAFLFICSIYQFKKTNLRLSVLAAVISILIYLGIFGLFNLIDQMEDGSAYKFSPVMLFIFLLLSALTVIPVFQAWSYKKRLDVFDQANSAPQS